LAGLTLERIADGHTLQAHADGESLTSFDHNWIDELHNDLGIVAGSLDPHGRRGSFQLGASRSRRSAAR
jgi:hypothetical protein